MLDFEAPIAFGRPLKRIRTHPTAQPVRTMAETPRKDASEEYSLLGRQRSRAKHRVVVKAKFLLNSRLDFA
jgi:hypothetical protein